MIVGKRGELDRLIASPTTPLRGLLAHGKDRSAVRDVADRMAAQVTARVDDPFDVARLTDTDLEGDPFKLIDELSALSMMGGRRLVRLRAAGEKPAIERLVVDAVQAHLAGALNPDAFFLIEWGPLERGSALRKATEAAPQFASAILYDEEPGDLSRRVREALAADGVALTSAAMELFLARLPHDRGVARQEIERLALYAGPGARVTLSPEDLQAFVGVEPDASLYEAAADAFGGRLREAHAGWRRARSEGESGVVAVRALGLHLARLRRARVFVAAGRTPGEASKALKIFWKQEQEFTRQLAAWRTSDLDTVQPQIFEADRACKSTGSPDALLAERLIMSVAAPRPSVRFVRQDQREKIVRKAERRDARPPPCSKEPLPGLTVDQGGRVRILTVSRGRAVP